MRTILVFRVLLAALALAACQSSLPAQFFEGRIIYEVNSVYRGDNERHRQYYESAKFGDTMILTVSSAGCYLRQYPNAGEYGYSYTLYVPSTNSVYTAFNCMDTVLAYRPVESAAIEEYISEIPQKELVCGTCKGLRYTGTDSIANLPIVMTFEYPQPPLPVDVLLWRDNYDFKINHLFAKSQSLFTHMRMDMEAYSTSFDAVRIEPASVNDDQCGLPVGSIVKWD